jgi:hypothetical protein
MTPFQQQCRQTIDTVTGRFGVIPHHGVHDYRQEGQAGGADRSLFLRTQFRHGDRLYDLYSYTDEAAASLDGNWYVLERREFVEDDVLVASLGRFLELCMNGEAPPDAFRTVRRRRV